MVYLHILSKIVDNIRGESTKRHWIIFDGDVDSEWVESYVTKRLVIGVIWRFRTWNYNCTACISWIICY
ncbi:dynein heavy chain 1, cytosolic [Rhizophagus irregularis DAOM 181602=DAOM 197198]|nr:dynein heavy chain 1, cytosolic [Rhizophagus irregularis DAOM 181602=DAOM 197198]